MSKLLTLATIIILGNPLVRFTNDATYPIEYPNPAEVHLVTNGDLCRYGLGSLDDFIHCQPYMMVYEDWITKFIR